MAYLAQVEWVFSEVGSVRHLVDEDSGCWARIWPISRFSPHRCEGPHGHLVRNSRANSVRLCATRGSYLAKVIPRLSFSTKKAIGDQSGLSERIACPRADKTSEHYDRTSPTTTPSSKPVMTYPHIREETKVDVIRATGLRSHRSTTSTTRVSPPPRPLSRVRIPHRPRSRMRQSPRCKHLGNLTTRRLMFQSPKFQLVEVKAVR
jgi:hypothetical protein